VFCATGVQSLREPSMIEERVVVKVGGSLYDLPDLGQRLQRWLASLETRRVLLVPGGGPTVDVIRALDACHHVGEEKSHWLALEALALNARFLAAILPHAAVVDGWRACPDCWNSCTVPILDALHFARMDEMKPDRLPHSWQVTSDSVAARAAAVGPAARLYLLKSVDVPVGAGWSEAGRRGAVDGFFAQALGSACVAEAVNLRTWKAP
jgi:5-(aminomethyl)-3-furanmethanol phosphate kinase